MFMHYIACHDALQVLRDILYPIPNGGDRTRSDNPGRRTVVASSWARIPCMMGLKGALASLTRNTTQVTTCAQVFFYLS